MEEERREQIKLSLSGFFNEPTRAKSAYLKVVDYFEREFPELDAEVFVDRLEDSMIDIIEELLEENE